MSIMTERQIDRIRQAEASMREAREVAGEIRSALDAANVKQPRAREELLKAAERLERQIEEIQNALREWRKDIN